MKVGLFIPCYVDALYPQVGMATYKLLHYLGVDVTYPHGQTCCGQPMANAGFERMSRPLVEKFERNFKDFDAVVIPSVSCAAFVRFNYPKILENCKVSKTTYEIVEFLHDVLKVKSLPGKFPHVVSVHNSCHGVRELGLSSPTELQGPRFNKIVDLLNMVSGITVKEPARQDECCGFGGMFAVEEPDVCKRMGEDKLADHMSTGAEYITGSDCSCLMHLQGIAKKEHKNIKFKHVVEILAAGL
ncbi:MAG: (Fe-S)-binding protein [Prevotella sp.]|jgi:L-lactate dehydrogenase complex protein LldE|uniref:(Fe-S)-binding protein n=1 Tax=Segatella cerevisiae TaxID=2053716 RepID=A0ABT1BYA2_9BACT|nr:(Fe-S)-binding protein [Segatella cerevisiae]MCH3994221.1 (Fe-S)-binding protein [Prevotella sp.]MCI1247259.1 (Fe-S)-binding protein [Prevotella sp.]MCO6026056.1 (Fe-S)-binding protein [Segatella cerevisiae]